MRRDLITFVRNPKTASSAIFSVLTKTGFEGVVRGNRSATHDFPLEPIPGLVFGVVRNPWARLVSGWGMDTRNKDISFNRWVKNDPAWLIEDYDFARTSQRLWLEHCTMILRFENLAEEFAQLGLGELPLANVNRKTTGHYTDYYDEWTRSHVEINFGWEIQKFGYRFGGD